MSITSDSPSESEGLSATLNKGTARVGGLGTVSPVASVVFTDKLLERVGVAVVEGVGGTTDIKLLTVADVMVGVAAVIVVGGAVDVTVGAAAVIVVGGAAVVTVDVAAVGGTVVAAMGGTLVDRVIGGAADSVMGGAPDVLVVAEVDEVVDTIAEDNSVVEEITLVDGAAVTVLKGGRAAVIATEVGGASAEVRTGLFMDTVDGAKTVTEDSIVVAATVGVAVEVLGVAKVGIDPVTTDLVSSDKMGTATVESLSAGGLVKVSSCSSSDGSVSSSLTSSLSFCPLKGFITLPTMLGSLALVEFNE